MHFLNTRILCYITCLLLAACGGGSSNRNPGPPPAPPVAVNFALASFQIPGSIASDASANADLSINRSSGAISGTVQTSGVSPQQVRLSEGFAGQYGTLITTLTDNGNGEWMIPEDTSLSAAQLDSLDQGGLFIDVTTDESANGVLRGQILLGNQQLFVNILQGDQEIPPVSTAASGFAGVTFDPDSGSMIVHVTSAELQDAVAGHVHLGFAGTNGGVVIELEQNPDDADHWRSPADTLADASIREALLTGQLYVNLHTPGYPAGELRGQILSTDFALTLVSLSGAQQVLPVATSASAHGALTFNQVTAEAQLHVTTAGLNNAVAGHIHSGFAGTSGNVDIELQQDPDNAAHWMTPAATSLTAEQMERMATGQWYVNLHTPAYPGGELRGQIAPQGISVITTLLSGGQQLPAVTSSASGIAGLTVNTVTSAIEMHITSQGVDDAVAAHIHQAFAGANGAVLVTLVQDSNDVNHWLAPAGTSLDDSGLAALSSGELYINVHTPAFPAGELRGQLLPANVQLFDFAMTGAQSVPAVMSAGTAYAAVTFNSNAYTLIANINAAGLDDAVAAHIHSGLAGDTGPVEIEFVQDPDNTARWSINSTQLDQRQIGLLNSGSLYLNLHTPANPAGEVRGQLVPTGIEVLFTNLSEADVVPASGATGSGIAATTINTSSHIINTNVNLVDLAGANAVTINQAPVMQVGPQLFSFVQDGLDSNRWRLAGTPLAGASYQALRNQGLYVQVTTALLPAGALRGQLQPLVSNPAPADAFVIAVVSPANGASAEAPAGIEILFNRNPLASSIDASQFELLASGADASFTEGNEVEITLPAPELTAAAVRFDLSGNVLPAETYRIRVIADAAGGLTDAAGLVLDGDLDGNPGGDFVATFSVVEAAPPAPTLTDVQTQIFSPTCATSGCHTGGAPAQGMNLSAGQTFTNTVGINSAQNPGLQRITAGDPDNSYLVQKIEGTAAAGLRMPLGQPVLSNSQIQLIRDWIADGAQDN